MIIQQSTRNQFVKQTLLSHAHLPPPPSEHGHERSARLFVKFAFFQKVVFCGKPYHFQHISDMCIYTHTQQGTVFTLVGYSNNYSSGLMFVYLCACANV